MSEPIHELIEALQSEVSVSRTDVGPVAHARSRGFASTIGMRHHIEGLLSFAKQIEPSYAAKCKRIFASIDWPI